MSEEKDSIPVHLMPVAAFLGVFSAVGLARIVYLVYANLTHQPQPRKPGPTPLGSNPFMILVAIVLGALTGYGKIVATINKAYAESEHALFDPFDILGITESLKDDKTAVTQAYREMAKVHHPDKGGSPKMFLKIQQAYEALTDELGIQNYQRFGHPEGPVKAPSFELALPSWLIFPEGRVAVIMMVLYVVMFIFIGYIVVVAMKPKKEPKVKATLDSYTVSLEDLGYIGKVLSPKSSHMEVLLAIASTPENIEWSVQYIDKIAEIREKATEERKNAKAESKNESLAFDDLDDQGWDDDEEGDDENAKQAAALAKQAELEKARQMEQLKKATGQAKEPLEGIDDGVLGQMWVLNVLTEKHKWPPENLYFLSSEKFDYKGKQVPALEHPGLQRNLQFTTGRINSRMLNTHPELCTY